MTKTKVIRAINNYHLTSKNMNSKTRDDKEQSISIHPVKFARQLFNRVNIARKASKYLLASVISLGIFFGLAGSSQAANWYVRAGAPGNGSGSDWTNAYTSLPATLVRGDTYYIADGSYSGHTFKDAVSGTSVITVKKATIADHGITAGWSDTYGDGQAVFGGLVFMTSYYLIDGATRNENNWQQTASYGIRVTGKIEAVTGNGSKATNVTFQYVDVGGPDGEFCTAKTPTEGFYVVYGGLGNWTIRRCHIHNVQTPIYIMGSNNSTVEYSHIGPSYSKEAISSQNTSGVIVRHNHFIDNLIYPLPACQHGGDGATADIWTREVSGSNNGWKIYGNVFGDTGTYNTIYRSNAAVLGNDYASGTVNNWQVYNNVFYNIQGDYNSIRFGPGSNNVAANNLWYKSRQSGQSIGISGATSVYTSWCYSTPYNLCPSSPGVWFTGSEDPFVDSANLDFRLKSSFSGTSPIDRGTALGVDFDAVDGLGNTRGSDGTWDIGAYEYVSGLPPSTYTLNVAKSGIGSGTVTGMGINCGSDCTETINTGASIILTASPDSGSIFSGWSGGGCSGTGACTVAMNSNTTVTASFNQSGSPVNLLTNGDFESGFTSGLSNNWQMTTDGSISYSVSQDTGYQGFSQKITVTTPGSWGLFFYQTPAFQLNQSYTWSFWYKTQGGDLWAEITDPPANQVVFQRQLSDTSGTWQYAALNFQYTNAQSDEIRFSSNTQGTYWLDNVELVATTDTTAPAAPTGVSVN